MPHEFLLSPEQSRASVRRQLAERFNVRAEGVDTGVVFYDTFDWMLHRAGYSLEFVSAPTPRARLVRLVDALACEQPLDGAPQPFAKDWPRGPVKAVIEKITDVRALLELVAVSGKRDNFGVLNHDGKTVCRLLVETWRVEDGREPGALFARLCVVPMRGWADEARDVAEALSGAGFLPARESLLDAALEEVGRAPRDYSQKFRIALDPEADAGVSAKAILGRLFEDMLRNEEGTRRDIDPEFLHDYRVAVRRTRSALSAFKRVLDPDGLAPFRDEFRNLGRLTGDKRNLDVHLIDFKAHLELLDEDRRSAMAPLRGVLESRREAAARELAKHLRAKEYTAFKREWKTFLARSPADGRDANMTTKEFSDRVLWKTYRKILADGRNIRGKSPDESLHDLRKLGKKFRYLMEFFQGLYGPRALKRAIAELKQLQDQLGLFQDLCVQMDTLAELRASDTSPAAREAIDRLMEGLAVRRRETRAAFGSHFRSFDTTANRARYRTLFKPAAN